MSHGLSKITPGLYYRIKNIGVPSVPILNLRFKLLRSTPYHCVQLILYNDSKNFNFNSVTFHSKTQT